MQLMGEAIRVAYQGAPGAFSEDAAVSYFATPGTVCLPQREFMDVRHAVLAGVATFGVLPIENSIHGPVTASLAAFDMGGLEVIGTVTCPIRLCLLAAPAAQPEQLRRVLSHPVALGQCRRFLAAMPLLEAVPFYDTAGAAEEVAARGDRTSAAVASQRAAAHYELDIIARNIEDRADNHTRFMIVARAVSSADRDRAQRARANGRGDCNQPSSRSRYGRCTCPERS
jgi:prephenate dehydratase